MPTFDFEEFDIHTAAVPYRDRSVGGQSLCTGCKHSHLYRRQREQDVRVFCHRLDRYVPPDIVECSEFRPVAALSLSQMMEIALPVDPRPGVSDGSYR